jgi:CelD/BcsL family acetyltransferase involved in cellulose biosynthesis
MQIRLVTSEKEFAALKPIWQTIFATNPNHTPFQTWEWNYSWWNHYGKPGDLRLFLAEQDGQLVGIAPMCLQRRFRGWPQAHLSFISRKRADYLDFLVPTGGEAAFFTAFFEHLNEHRKDWGFLDLSDLRQDSTNVAHILTTATRVFPAATVEAREICVTVPLTRTWEEFLASLGKNARRNIGRYGRQLEKEFAVSFKIPADAVQMRKCLADFAQVYHSRWKEDHSETYFEQPEAAAFERQLCELGTEAGWYRLYMLYADEKPVAGYLGYVCHGQYYAGLLAHVPEFHKYSVGTVLIAKTVEDCIRNGWSALDMTRGDEPYKYHWNGIKKRNFHLRVFANRLALVRAAIADGLYRRATEIDWLHRLRAVARGQRAMVQAPGPSVTPAE